MDAATTAEMELAQQRLEGMVWDELLRVVKAIRVDNALGVNPELLITVSRYGGPALVIDEEEVAPLTIVTLQEMIGQNLDVELYNGRLNIYSPSWAPSRIPF